MILYFCCCLKIYFIYEYTAHLSNPPFIPSILVCPCLPSLFLPHFYVNPLSPLSTKCAYGYRAIIYWSMGSLWGGTSKEIWSSSSQQPRIANGSLGRSGTSGDPLLAMLEFWLAYIGLVQIILAAVCPYVQQLSHVWKIPFLSSLPLFLALWMLCPLLERFLCMKGSNVAHMCHLWLRLSRSLFLCSRLLFLFSSSCSGSVLKIKEWAIQMFWTRTEAFLCQCQTTLVLYFFKNMLVTSAHPHMLPCSDSQPAGRNPYGGYRAPSWRSPKTFWKPRYLHYNP